MAENVLKIGRNNTFRFEGTVNITDKTFVINKTNEKGTWVQNRMGLSIDCGESGYQFVSLNGGYSPNGSNILYLATVDENGQFLGREHNLEIEFEKRNELTEEDMKKLNKRNLVTVTLDEGEKVFVAAYDAILYIKEHLKDGDIVVVKGNIEETPSTDGDDWFTNHIVNEIKLKNKEFFNPSAYADYSFLVDGSVVGQPNLEENNVPLFFKGLTYVRKIGDNKYNQVCAFPKKVLYEADDFGTPKGNEKFTYGVNHFFTPTEKGFVDEIAIRCKYKSGAKTTNVKLEDLPKDIQQGIAMGFITEEQIIANATAVSGNRTTDLVFNRILTKREEIKDNDGNTSMKFKFIKEPKKYKESEVLGFEDLTPIENSSVKAAPSDNYEIADEEINETAQNILNMFASFGNN